MDIVTIGEVLIDLTQTGKDEKGIPQFAANPGGAPANLAVAAAKLGAQTAFIGKVGADAFGRYLKEVLAENKVDVSGMAVDADHPTTMAVVSVDATGERDFSFYRSANADVMLSKEDISDEALKAAKIAQLPQRLQIDFLNIIGRRFHDDLKLMVLVQTVRIIAVTSVIRTAGRFHIRHIPRLRPDGSEKRRRIHRPRPFLYIIRLLQYAAPRRPELLERQNNLLKSHMSSCK